MRIATAWIKEYGSERNVKVTISDEEIEEAMKAKLCESECSEDAKIDIVFEN